MDIPNLTDIFFLNLDRRSLTVAEEDPLLRVLGTAQRRVDTLDIPRLRQPATYRDLYEIVPDHLDMRRDFQVTQADEAIQKFADVLSEVTKLTGASTAGPREVQVALSIICPLWPIC